VAEIRGAGLARLGARGEALFGLAREFGRGGVLGEMRAILARL
jgi:hypothetical protein